LLLRSYYEFLYLLLFSFFVYYLNEYILIVYHSELEKYLCVFILIEILFCDIISGYKQSFFISINLEIVFIKNRLVYFIFLNTFDQPMQLLPINKHSPSLNINKILLLILPQSHKHKFPILLSQLPFYNSGCFLVHLQKHFCEKGGIFSEDLGHLID
jgi:hypothetical protein